MNVSTVNTKRDLHCGNNCKKTKADNMISKCSSYIRETCIALREKKTVASNIIK